MQHADITDDMITAVALYLMPEDSFECEIWEKGGILAASVRKRAWYAILAFHDLERREPEHLELRAVSTDLLILS